MTTPEQEARDLLERIGVPDAQSYNAGDLVELANLIARRRALDAAVAAIEGADPLNPPAYSTDPALANIIIEREGIATWFHKAPLPRWYANYPFDSGYNAGGYIDTNDYLSVRGATPTEAAMRCWVDAVKRGAAKP